ncbi:MAG: SUMF1/EgtB/PvdO family nonheme iron enzyme [Gammaproteobacteria bacterium]
MPITEAMNTGKWRNRFYTLQDLLLKTVRQAAHPDYKLQFHPDLSPMGWHLGHSVFTETYWIREIVMRNDEISSGLKDLYTPEQSPKSQRGDALPPHHELCNWAELMQRENRELLERHIQHHADHELMQNNYLWNFLSQHYAQHYETATLIRLQRALQQSRDFIVANPLQSSMPERNTVKIVSGKYCIGASGTCAPYDNEYPDFSAPLDEFHIALTPVSNAEYLAFMETGGYDSSDYWDDAGWDWRLQEAAVYPDHWRQDPEGHYYGHDAGGPCQLDPDSPVHGVNHYEASAFARWAGARLPHEYEWEAANLTGALQACGQVWEWCANTFHPYEGFRAFPYSGYSIPYFDGKHYSLRGGGAYTQEVIKRPTFRNYYQADKRHIYAGIRLVYD